MNNSIFLTTKNSQCTQSSKLNFGGTLWNYVEKICAKNLYCTFYHSIVAVNIFFQFDVFET